MCDYDLLVTWCKYTLPAAACTMCTVLQYIHNGPWLWLLGLLAIKYHHETYLASKEMNVFHAPIWQSFTSQIMQVMT